ncbi:hypothetical protein [Citrobacter sp. Cc139]|uniref:hypothetical protein n=1 Tax=Citrobacter sp. Cc139 TaxID=2985037 RepID=UPI0025774B3E|nr:hypothetical protein [Citrobacter sp. Cc139]MDM3295907.1 hypothetical protein [Citrobacter sp. Cc139]
MDFKKYLSSGLEAAKVARKNKNEIQGVISDLSDVIKEHSGGLVTLIISNEQRMSKNVNSFGIGAAAAAAAAGLGLSPYIDYKALSLVLTKDKVIKREQIAEWRMNESDGYPCVISYNGRDINCGSKEMLEKALGGLISNASTGERLLQLIAEGSKE